MTENTKKLFNAPWAVDEKQSETFGEVFDVMDEELYLHYARCYDEKTANRLARLPELYDALNEAVKEVCDKCDGSLPDCKNNCKWFSWTKLLRKVRDGE